MSVSSDLKFISEQIPTPYSRLLGLENRLNELLIDQPDAVQNVAEMIKNIETGFYDENKPKGVFVFAGPTGVGKTSLAKIIADEMKLPLYRFDMSEFSEAHKVSRFLGSPPGYINSEQGGELVNKLKKTPSCLVLFDEIEKAHPDIYTIFLQLFDEGRITDSMGHEVNSKEAIFILTTNLGSNEIYEKIQEKKKNHFDERLKALFIRTFSPELYNRIDKIVIFNPLKASSIEKIVEKYLYTLKQTFSKRSVEITWDKQVTLYLSKLNSDMSFGAREIHRKVREHILPKLTESRIEGKILQNDVKVHFEIIDNQLKLTILDKGKISNNNEEIIQKDHSKAIFFKNDILYVDLIHKRCLRDFIGFYVYRVTPNNRDKSFMESCIKIINVSSMGETIFEEDNKFSKTKNFLSAEWNDEEWRLVTPERDGRAFFENICSILNGAKKSIAMTLIDRIFNHLEKNCHLQEGALFPSLINYCYKLQKTELIEDVKSLENLIGTISFITITSRL